MKKRETARVGKKPKKASGLKKPAKTIWACRGWLGTVRRTRKEIKLYCRLGLATCEDCPGPVKYQRVEE